MRLLQNKFYSTLIVFVFCTGYLNGQPLKFTPSQLLSARFNSGSEESLPLYSPSDSTLYFVRTLYKNNTGGLLSGQDIWYAKKDNMGNWSEPLNDLQALNNKGNNAVVGISKEGNTLYLLNSYNTSDSREPGIALSFQRDNRWGKPSDFSVPSLSGIQGDFYGFYINPTETILLISMRGENSLGAEDIYISLKNTNTGEWSAPKHLGPEINSVGFEISPYLSSDTKTLYFASSGHPGFGNADIFMSTRLDNTWENWSEPVNLGSEINSPAFDAYFSINPDNQAFFVSNRDGSSTDIYQSQLIDENSPASFANGSTGEENLVLTEEERRLNEETMALIEETKKLLEEFNQAKSGKKPGNSSKLKTNNTIFARERILFDLNSSEVNDSTAGVLDSLKQTLAENTNLNVEIVGHADDLGNSDYNLKLSINRALSVKNYLIRNGVQEDRIITYGKGETEPAAKGNTDENRKQNRRVEINLLNM